MVGHSSTTFGETSRAARRMRTIAVARVSVRYASLTGTTQATVCKWSNFPDRSSPFQTADSTCEGSGPEHPPMTVMQSRNDLVRSVGSECSISVLAATVRKAIKRPAGAHVDPAELAPTTPGALYCFANGG